MDYQKLYRQETPNSVCVYVRIVYDIFEDDHDDDEDGDEDEDEEEEDEVQDGDVEEMMIMLKRMRCRMVMLRK